MERDAKIFVAGHRGMVGSAIERNLSSRGYKNLVLRTRSELDLLDQRSVATFFKKERPDYVFLAAALVGGILENSTRKADFIYENLQVQNNIIHNSWKTEVKKLLFLGSSCIYPRNCRQPMREEYLLSGPLEETNDAYAIAKIAGIKMCQSFNDQYGTKFISIMPTNLYGPYDNFDLDSSHVLPAMIRKFHDGKVSGSRSVSLWGTGNVFREFLHVDDLAQACVFLMDNMDNYEGSEIINCGCGNDLTIRELATKIKTTVGYEGDIIWDNTKPDGTPKKLLDISKLINMGWRPEVSLDEGISSVYRHFIENNE